MTKVHFTDEFKRDAVAQIVDRGYSAFDVSKRLGLTSIRFTSGRSSFRVLRG